MDPTIIFVAVQSWGLATPLVQENNLEMQINYDIYKVISRVTWYLIFTSKFVTLMCTSVTGDFVFSVLVIVKNRNFVFSRSLYDPDRQRDGRVEQASFSS